MMNIIDTNDFNNSCCNDNMNLNTFADQPLSSVFDCSTTSMNNNLDLGINNNSNNMNGGMGNNVNGFDTNQNRLLLKHIRNRNTKDFKDIVANFWNPSQNNNSFQQSRTTQNQGVKNTMPNTSMPRRTPSADAFGNFHPIDMSASKNKNNFNNGKPNAAMEMRIPLETPSCGAPTFTPRNIAIKKNLFRPFVNNGCASNLMDSTMMPPMTQSMNNLANSRRVSMSSSSTLISDDSNHSQNSFKPSASDIINAATNIVNGNDFDGNLFNPNTSMNNVMSNMNDSMPSNCLSEPGPYDIVCGRNSGAYNYIGNRRFRVTIEMNLQRYIDSPTREDKTNVIKSIVWMLHEQVGARFLKKETCKKSSCGGGRKRGTPRYTIMTDKQAREKVGHALRDLVITARKEQQQEKKQPKEQVPKISV